MAENFTHGSDEANSDSEVQEIEPLVLFVLHAKNVIEDFSGNILIVVSATPARETKKAMKTLPTLQIPLFCKTQQSSQIRTWLKTLKLP
jgi:hypothetical protein